VKINEFSSEVYKLHIPQVFEIRFRTLDGRIFIIDNVIKEVKDNIVYLEGYETPYKD